MWVLRDFSLLNFIYFLWTFLRDISDFQKTNDNIVCILKQKSLCSAERIDLVCYLYTSRINKPPLEFSYTLSINLGLMKTSGVMKCSEPGRFKPAAALAVGDPSKMPPVLPGGWEAPAPSSPSATPVCCGLGWQCCGSHTGSLQLQHPVTVMAWILFY